MGMQQFDMSRASASSRLTYRALDGTNTKTRRLAYLTTMISILGRRSLGERVFLARLVRWNREHKRHLNDYWVQTGEITSTRHNSAGARYLRLATDLRLIASVSAAYRTTRIGLVLHALIRKLGSDNNPFFLTNVEQLFYMYTLLGKDADILLTVIDGVTDHLGVSLAHLQRTFQERFLERVNQKFTLSQNKMLKQLLLQRRMEIKDWRRPERYAEHLVPPRLNWLLDLGLLEPEPFTRHRYFLTEKGKRFIESLFRPKGASFSDVNDRWLASEFWLTTVPELLEIKPLTDWKQLDEKRRRTLCAQLLQEAFEAFRHTVVPKISLTQALLYLSTALMLEYQIGVGPFHLREWLSTSKTLDSYRYQIRSSPRENVSYLIVTHL
jgi:hypothetical protein